MSVYLIDLKQRRDIVEITGCSVQHICRNLLEGVELSPGTLHDVDRLWRLVF